MVGEVVADGSAEQIRKSLISSTSPSLIRQCGDQFAITIREPFAGRGAERFDEVQVIMRRYHRAVPQVGCQQRQLGFDIGAGPVPAQQSVHSEAMSKIVNPWQAAFRGDDAAFLKQRLNRVSQGRAAICSSAPGGVPDEGRIWEKREAFAGLEHADTDPSLRRLSH